MPPAEAWEAMSTHALLDATVPATESSSLTSWIAGAATVVSILLDSPDGDIVIVDDDSVNHDTPSIIHSVPANLRLITSEEVLTGVS